MKEGTVWQRHTGDCPPKIDGGRASHRCRGSWAYAVDLGPDSTGRRRQTTKSGFPTKAAATAALRELAKTLATDVTVTNTTVGEYLDTWLLGKHALRPTTRTMYEGLANLYIRPRIGHVRLLELRAHHLDRFYADISVGVRGKPLSPSTIRRVHAVLRSGLNSAVKRRLIPYNPADHVELAPENPKRPKPWTAEQCLRFLDAVKDDRLYPLYRLYLVTGLRRGEGLALRWSSIDIERGLLAITEQVTEVNGRAVTGKPKTRRSVRMVSIDEAMTQVLKDHRKRQAEERAAWGQTPDPDGIAFTREDGSALRPEYVTRHFQALAAAAGLPVIRLHDLRHTSASLALSAGVALKVVSDRLGHSTISITGDLYTHVHDEVARDAADRIAGLLRSTPAADVSGMLAPDPGEQAS